MNCYRPSRVELPAWAASEPTAGEVVRQNGREKGRRLAMSIATGASCTRLLTGLSLCDVIFLGFGSKKMYNDQKPLFPHKLALKSATPPCCSIRTSWNCRVKALEKHHSFWHRSDQAEWECNCRPDALTRPLATEFAGFRLFSNMAEESGDLSSNWTILERAP